MVLQYAILRNFDCTMSYPITGRIIFFVDFHDITKNWFILSTDSKTRRLKETCSKILSNSRVKSIMTVLYPFILIFIIIYPYCSHAVCEHPTTVKVPLDF